MITMALNNDSYVHKYARGSAHSDLGLSSRPRSYMKYLEFQIFHFHFLLSSIITYYLILLIVGCPRR